MGLLHIEMIQANCAHLSMLYSPSSKVIYLTKIYLTLINIASIPRTPENPPSPKHTLKILKHFLEIWEIGLHRMVWEANLYSSHLFTLFSGVGDTKPNEEGDEDEGLEE